MIVAFNNLLIINKLLNIYVETMHYFCPSMVFDPMANSIAQGL